MTIVIQLPVTRFVRAVLTERYGEKIICGHNQNKTFLHRLQQHSFNDNNEAPAKLTTHVEVHAKGKFAKELKAANLFAIGLSLDKQLRREMYEFIYAQVDAGISAFSSLRYYYEQHKVQEDDFSIDSAYRAWLRFKKQKNKSKKIVFDKIVRSIHAYDVVVETERLKERLEGQKVKIKEIEKAVFRATSLDAAVYSSRTRQAAFFQTRILLMYLLHSYNIMSYAAIAKRFGFSKSSVHEHVQRFPDKLENEKDLSDKYAKILHYLNERPLSVLTYRAMTT